MLHFDSLDRDKKERNVYPVNITTIHDAEGKDINYDNMNVINQFRDHTFNGIYPGLIKLGRFAAIIGVANKNREKQSWHDGYELPNFYNIEFTGTTPKHLRFRIEGDEKSYRGAAFI